MTSSWAFRPLSGCARRPGISRGAEAGTTDLHSFVMFVVDAGRPFSHPAKLP
ncbi:MAG TPA: hypothetical protein VJX92_10765 [Methylomirabilota bacterium]|nr:hypothetical protein [Methylomirabilota bacterium]